MRRRRTLSLHFDEWPDHDCRSWSHGVAPAAGLYDDTGGAAERFSARSLAKWAGSYAVWLSFLARTGALDAAVRPASRVTPEQIDAWIDEQRARGVRDSTINGRLRDLHAALRVMQPDAELRFILRPHGVGLQRALPPTPKPFAIVETRELMARAMALFSVGVAGGRYAGGDAAIRDATLLGLLAAHAPRIGSVAAMRLGKQLVRTETGYRAEFGVPDTKTKRPLAFDLHPELVHLFDVYLATARPRLGGAGTEWLWCGTRGRALGIRGLSKICLRRTTEWFGQAHGPHWFRKCLRSSAARYSAEAALDAAVMLGHGPEVSVRHYTEAGATSALRRHGRRITRLRARTRLLAERFFRERDAVGTLEGQV